MKRSIVLVVIATALGLSACTSTPTPAPDATATSTSSSTATPPAAVVTTVVTQTVTNQPPPPAKPVIGSFGYGPLKLGMTLQQALDTKLITPDLGSHPDSACTSHKILGTDQGVAISKKLGVASITFTPEMTSDGVGIGATEEKLKAEYTNLRPVGPNYTWAADADNNPAATFVFGVDKEKKTLWAAYLALKDQECHN
ncbi:hypothetical protein SAMN04488564_104436 [Lentzea waywayandensis]|uniref:Uncharacterized protein n=1 Tax=Lentzea waywayandensis TaxID=84724 RepID=A0A1I6EG97_9PSEU|nr:hypothetical protein [Lentzea waywayandensis]SFR16754.1 hypothetical protein SAMN04488564_104436 [Lentzea waywayandensis]